MRVPRTLLICCSLVFIFSSLHIVRAQQSEATKPTKLAAIYQVPENASTGSTLSSSDIAKKFSTIIYHRAFKDKIAEYTSNGFAGISLQYILLDGIAAPADIGKTTECSSSQKSFKSYENNITLEAGDFCRIQESIIKKTSFDHDLDATTPNVVATEDWFLHDSSSNNRLGRSGSGGYNFYPNPANAHVKEYFISRIVREMVGGKNADGATYSASGFAGIYLDNVGLSWENPKKEGTIKEFASTTEYADSVFEWVKQIHAALHSGNRNLPLWGNMIGGKNDGAQWDRYMPYLEGGLLESFAISWGNDYFSAKTLNNQLTQFEKWQAGDTQGKNHFVSVVQGMSAGTEEQLYGLAAYLLGTDGENSSYFFADNINYSKFYDLKDGQGDSYYDYKLGKPLESRKVLKRDANTDPIQYSRQFQCGSVELDVQNHTGRITLSSSCTTVPTPVPTTTPCERKAKGDANCDNALDLIDFSIFREEFIQHRNQIPNLTFEADFNKDQSVDLLDFEIFRSEYVKAITPLTPTPVVQTPVPSVSIAPTNEISIWRPRFATPEFVQPGKTITAEVIGNSALAQSGWKAWVANDLRKWDVEVTGAAYGKINNDTQPGWKLTLKLPSDVSTELHSLHVAHTSIGSTASENSVSVVKDFETDFYALQLTDEHVLRLMRSASEDQSECGSACGYRSAELVKWAVPVINLINPRFVLISGDVTSKYEGSTYNTVNKEALYEWYRDAKTDYQVPAVIVPGNHDIPYDSTYAAKHAQGVLDWEKTFGQRSFVTRLGSFYILGHDYSDTDLKQWAQNTYKQSYTDTSIRYRLILQHYKDWAAYIPESSQPCDLMLIGHLHHTENNTTPVSGDPNRVGVKTTCSRTIMTIAAHKWQKAGYLEFDKTSDGSWNFVNGPTYSDSTSVFSLVGDNGVPKVSEKYLQLNNGSAVENSVTITNNLSKNFTDGRIRFLMQTGDYIVSGGEIVSSYTYDNGSKTAVVVKVPIKTGSTTVTIQKKTTAMNISPLPIALVFGTTCRKKQKKPHLS